MPEGIDEQAFQDFLDESRELLSNLEPTILELENNPDDPGLVDEPFRILHSIKGMSSFFNLSPIKTVSHRLEDLLGEIRDDRMTVDGDVIDVLFNGTEILHRLYDEVFEGNLDIQLAEDEKDLLDRIESLIERGESLEVFISNSIDSMESSVANLLDDPELADHPELETIRETLVEVDTRIHQTEEGEGAEDDELPSRLFHESHEYRGVQIGELFQELEEIARDIIDRRIDQAPDETVESFTGRLRDLIEMAHDQEWENVVPHLETMLDEIKQFRETAGFGYVLCRSLLQHLDSVYETMNLSPPETDEGDEDRPRTGTDGEVRKTFRVDEEKVDDFMNYVGELIVTGEMYRHLQQEIAGEPVDTEIRNQFKNTNQAFKDLSDNLQQSLMDIRKVEMDSLLKKYPVLVRKLSGKLDKEITVEIEGRDVEVDKSLIEQLETPLTHLVRNAVDHGIEDPDERERNGKSPEGTIHIRVEEQEEDLLVTISDDGSGLDADEMRRMCVERNILSEREAADQTYDEIIQYIFHSGFSTADEVSDVSGRGVGMDAVRESVQQINGEIDLESEPGQGTTVTISMPKAQAIIVVDGLVVEVDRYQFIIPIDRVLESISRDKADLTSVEDRGEMLNLRGTLYPLFRLREILGLDFRERQDGDRDVVMVLEEEDVEFSIIVDDILEQQKVVVKDMGPIFRNVDFVSGSAVMGDGRVCLVLNVEGLGKESRSLRDQSEAIK